MTDESNRPAQRRTETIARAALALIAMLTSAPSPASETQLSVTEHRELIYMSPGGHDLHLDVYSPASGHKRTPVWIHVHGGAWWKGARPNSWQGFSAYLDAGFSIVTVQYRLAGVASAPAAVQDVRCAMSWVGKNADRFGFDTDRIVVTGTSAGGHLALMGGMLTNHDDIDLPECREPPPAAAIVDFYGPTDLDTWPAPNPSGGFSKAPHTSIARWLGAAADNPAVRKRMSPVSHVGADLPPIFIVHGDADPVVPLQESLNLKQKLDAVGARSALHVVPAGVHGKFNDEQRRAIEQDVLTFLRRHGVLDE